MEKATVSIHADLMLKIQEIQESKEYQEQELKENFREFANELSPVSVVKSSIHELVNSKEVQFDLLKGGMKLGASYLIKRSFNNNLGIKGFLSSLLLEKLSSSFIEANSADLVVGVIDMFFDTSEKSE